MNILVYTITATLTISLCSLFGIISLVLKREKVQQILLFLVSFAAGTLMGGAFLHLIPEAIGRGSIETVNLYVILAFIVFFLIEKLLHWHHHHEAMDEIHTTGYMSLIADALHNFLDGLIIAAAFQLGTDIGVVTAVAVVLHEIPQEIGDFGVLLHSGFSVKKALFYNFVAATTSVLGGVIGYFWIGTIDNIIPNIMAFAAGSFIYIAASDLLPEIRQETDTKKSWLSFLLFLAGVGLMFLIRG